MANYISKILALSISLPAYLYFIPVQQREGFPSFSPSLAIICLGTQLSMPRADLALVRQLKISEPLAAKRLELDPYRFSGGYLPIISDASYGQSERKYKVVP